MAADWNLGVTALLVIASTLWLAHWIVFISVFHVHPQLGVMVAQAR